MSQFGMRFQAMAVGKTADACDMVAVVDWTTRKEVWRREFDPAEDTRVGIDQASDISDRLNAVGNRFQEMCQ